MHRVVFNYSKLAQNKSLGCNNCYIKNNCLFIFQKPCILLFWIHFQSNLIGDINYMERDFPSMKDFYWFGWKVIFINTEIVLSLLTLI